MDIRNFCIIAHIDHGKSTLADRMLELTGTIEKRKMKEQVLDRMDLERERGITIKMQPVRMEFDGYVLNLIDTPGHIDFTYEVSRSLRAVEGAVLLVDATQGVQAQTFSNLEMAQDLGLKIIPVINKIDLPNARPEEVKEEIVQLLNCSPEEILEVSAKTGQGVEDLLKAIIKKIPASSKEKKDGVETEGAKALIFDYAYSTHQGIIAYVRVFEGKMEKGDDLILANAGEKFKCQEVGVFSPELKESEELNTNEIGYVVTNIKTPGLVKVGDTITFEKNPMPALSGYKEPKPMIWASLYPSEQDDFDNLKIALEKLRLSDSAFSFQEESSGPPVGGLGRGFKSGFLGMLHLEIVSERIRREFGIQIIVANPTVAYRILYKNGKEEMIYSASVFPEENKVKTVFETWVDAEILAPPDKISLILRLLREYQAEIGETKEFGSRRVLLKIKISLRELMRNFFDALKSVSSGYASLNYEIGEERPADVLKLEILLAEEIVPAFSRIVPRFRIQRQAEEMVVKLRELLPRELFAVKIQAKGLGRIIASRTLSALKKNVTGHLYGGDRTRKMKLWKKQKEGKKRLKARGSVNIPQEVFLKMIQN